MTPALFFLAVDLALVGGAVLLLFAVILRRGRVGTNLFLAMLLIALAIGVWITAIRSPIGP